MWRYVCLWWWGLVCGWGVALAAPTASALHLTSAEWLQTRGPAAPPAQVDSRSLLGDWQPVTLPFAQRHDILGQAATALDSPDGTVVSWYRLRLPAAGSVSTAGEG